MNVTGQSADRFPPDIPTPTRTGPQRFLAFVLILAILGVGGFGAKWLMDTKPKPVRKPPQKMQTLVRVEEAVAVSTMVRIKALGRMVPEQDLTIQPEVTGRVVELHPDFRPGGFIREGEILVRLDEVDYRLALEQKNNRLQQAEADLRLEEGEQRVAGQEWAAVNREMPDLDQTGLDLVLRKPQLAKAAANVDIARTEVRLARLNLERTVIRAPFNSMIRETRIDLGSRVTSQSPLAVVCGTDRFRAEITVPVAELSWIDLPRGERPGAKVMIHSHDDQPYEGRIISLLPDLDRDGLMAALHVAVPDPLGLEQERKPLLLGSYIRAEIIGRPLDNVFKVPRNAVVDGDKVLLATEELTLHIQPVSAVWKDERFLYLDQGLQDGNRIIVSTVAAPIEGMSLNLGGSGATEGTGLEGKQE